MTKENHIICAYAIDGKGKGIPLQGDAITKTLKAKDLGWVHLDATHADTRSWLKKNVSYLDDLILNALLADETRPRVTQHKNGVLLILRGVNLNDNADPEDMISVRLWIDENRIISVCRRKLKTIEDIKAQLAEGTGPEDSGDFLVMFMARLFNRMESVIMDLNEATDEIEEHILEKPDYGCRQAINDIRRKAAIFLRHISPQRDIISLFYTMKLSWLSEDNKRHLQESLNIITRYTEDLHMVRERTQIVKDDLANALADRMNRNMYILSIVTTVFLPLGFLTGLLGINVGGMPGADSDIAFWIVVAACVGFGAVSFGLFRLLKWI